MPENCDWTPWHYDIQQALQSLDQLLNGETRIHPIAERESKLREDLQNLDNLLKKESSHEMDKFVRLVCESGYLARYKVHFIIVRYHYVIKGVRMVVTDGNRHYPLPKLQGAFYWVTWGMQKYIDAGWEVEDQFSVPHSS